MSAIVFGWALRTTMLWHLCGWNLWVMHAYEVSRGALTWVLPFLTLMHTSHCMHPVVFNVLWFVQDCSECRCVLLHACAGVSVLLCVRSCVCFLEYMQVCLHMYVRDFCTDECLRLCLSTG